MGGCNRIMLMNIQKQEVEKNGDVTWRSQNDTYFIVDNNEIAF